MDAGPISTWLPRFLAHFCKFIAEHSICLIATNKTLYARNLQTMSDSLRKPSDLTPEKFVGGSYGVWIKHLPVSWIPYVQLTRLNIAAPIALVYFPHLLGILHAAATNKFEPHYPEHVIKTALLLFVASLFYSNAAHAWDDLIDASIDKKMTRTKSRPIPRGAVSPRAALIFTIASGLGAASFLIALPTVTAFTIIPSAIAATYYPWAKRHTAVPQVVLGIGLAWGIMVGNASLTGNYWPWEDWSANCLVLAYTFVMVIYDTIYAYQDVSDDIHLGLGSTAVLFRNHLKLALSLCTLCMTFFLYCCGVLAEAGIAYMAIAVGGSSLSVGLMLYMVRLSDSTSCWLWFSTGFWTTILCMTFGILSEYAFD